MASHRTDLCIVNTSAREITDIYIDQIDNYDWDGDSRPDHNFQHVSIKDEDSRCEREDLNSYAKTAWYRMKLTFPNGDWLRFRNDQKEARTKIDRFYSCEGPASEYLTIFQTSGADMNAMYIRDKQEPDNSGWMSYLQTKKSDLRLNQITMPASHDAGMYTTCGCTFGTSPEWARTQSYDIKGQLIAGSRYFDLRVYHDGNDFCIGHFSHISGLGNNGCYGPKLSDVLNQVLDFMQHRAGNKESVILAFTHTMSDSPRSYPKDKVAEYVVSQVKQVFGSYLYTSKNLGANLANTLLSELAGKVVTVFGDEFNRYYDVNSGIFPCRDSSTAGYGLRVYDNYSSTDSFDTMCNDQINKLQNNGGYNNDYLFLLSWTLTAKSANLLDIECLSTIARPRLLPILTKIGNKALKTPNLVYYDYVDPYICRAIIAVNYHV